VNQQNLTGCVNTMNQPFKHSADSLLSFFSQPGRGFYIPYYQRNYSWDEENAEKLITDIFSGVKRVVTKPNNSIFLGTVILHDEKNVSVGVHTDTPNLITKVSNVVDGQQRIVSIGLVASTLSFYISEVVRELKSYASTSDEFSTLAQELDDQQPDIRELYSVEIRKTGAQPRLKPLIIRAGDVSSNPVSDQWTLAGNSASFYSSNSAKFLSDFISGTSVPDIVTDDRISSVVQVFLDQIDSELNSVDYMLANDLLTANSVEEGSLFSFLDYPPDLGTIHGLPDEEKKAFYRGMLLLAACSFLKNSCHFVVIECNDESIAFDMFQSLNATGTPLTAFEVFKPTIVKSYGVNYPTEIKPEVDRVEKVFEKESTASGKEDLTDKVIGSSALVYNGTILNSKFSEERDWLVDSFPTQQGDSAKEFISCIADQAEYRCQFIRPRKSKKDSANFGFVSHLQSLGLNIKEADMAALCICYIRDAGHQFAHRVISVFYTKLLRAQGNATNIGIAAAEFHSVCQATAAFFTLWMGALNGRFPDAVYRDLFQSTSANISVKSGTENQTSSFVKDIFRTALEKNKIYDAGDVSLSRSIWVEQAKGASWYSKKSLCRFALFVASHDAAPDLTVGNEGLFTDGMPNSADFLNCKSWHSSDYEVIEHVATRDRPSSIKFDDYFDESIYPGNKSVVDKLGNLTLLSVRVNSSVYSEWPDKAFYYWNLTTPQSTVNSPTGTELMEALGLSTIPPSLSVLTSTSNYLPHLAPLAYLGVKGLKWDRSFIDKRSEHLCTRVFDKVDSWLR